LESDLNLISLATVSSALKNLRLNQPTFLHGRGRAMPRGVAMVMRWDSALTNSWQWVNAFEETIPPGLMFLHILPDKH
jgi:hypothetical protein